MARFAIGTLTQCTNLAKDVWDLARTGRSRLTDPTAQRSGTGGAPRVVCVATALVSLRQHPTVLTRYAVCVDKQGDADATSVVQFYEDRPAVRALLDDGPQITTTFPDGVTATRDNHFWSVDAATTAARYLRLRRIVLPDAWSAAIVYAIGDTCWRLTGGIAVGFRCLVAHTGSAPTLANANWSAYLGPLPAGWDPVGP